jgi:cytochrome c biogenesis protein CcmG/thiol:disulfide interchange protein DsbE
MTKWLLTLVLIAAFTGCDGERPLVPNGRRAPSFELTHLDGGRVRLAELRGQVVAIRFWADWCRFCKTEMRELEPEYRRLAPRGLRILAVNVEQERERVARTVGQIEFSYDTLLDGDGAVARDYGVIALPVTFLVDRDGVVRGKIIGESDAATFSRLVEPLL